MTMQIVSNNIAIATAKIQEALKNCPSEPVAVGTGTTQQLDLAKMSVDFRRALMATDLTRNQRAQIAATLGDKSKILDEVVSSPSQLEKLLKTLVDPNDLPIEIQIGQRWYPFPVQNVSLYTNQMHGSSVSMQTAGKIVDQSLQKHWHWTDEDFKDENRQPRKRTVRELLAEEGVRMSSQETLESFRDRSGRAGKMASEHGKVLSNHGPVLQHNKYLWQGSLDTLALGTKQKPRQLIVEGELEIGQGRQSYYGGHQATDHDLPFVRAFSTDLKKYVYVDIDDVQEYTFDTRATDRLVLPQKMKKVLDQIFETSTSEIFGDLFKGRHGGMVVLANGPQGVGKTLTAECFAEHTNRPLYVLEMGELGTNLASVEESLQKIFARAARWNAVLLFDEADVFLAKREETDLERSAIVGVFLRLLDRYEGMFFLTTNRASVIDPAFKSRITLKLDYPELDGAARKRIWDSMLEGAGFLVKGDLGDVYEKKIDGRQIRNQVRLLRVMHKSREITADDVREGMEYIVTDIH